MKLLLARHGQSVWNEVRRFQGTTDVGLSALGRRQAEALGRAVRRRKLAAAYVSPMERALDTATIALAGTGVPIVPMDELRELCLGEWEGFTIGEISGRDGDPYRPVGARAARLSTARVRAVAGRLRAGGRRDRPDRRRPIPTVTTS